MGVMVTESAQGTASPAETATLLFTDIEGSTQLLEALREEYPSVIVRFRELLEEATARHGGARADAQGDAFFATFRQAADGVRAAIDIQYALDAEAWPRRSVVRVRIGLHTGQPRTVGGTYFGIDVHRAARIAAAASGGQVLLSAATRDQLFNEDLPAGVIIRDLGSHRLKDIRLPEVLFDLSIPGLADSYPSLRSQDARPNNLPVAPTTFVGREEAIREVQAMLMNGETRLLTLTGPGGAGKTRLAIEAARGLLGHFPHGVFLVELAPVLDPDLLASTIVQTLGFPEFASRTPLDILKHHLASRRPLLILDNFEQIVDAATTVADLLNACPHLTVVVTSREALNVRLERELVVPPLALPDERAPADAGSLAGVESVQLLIDRIRDHDRHFAATPENVVALRAICLRLDGLPLALELAASQLRLFTPQSLLENLHDSMEVLGGGRRDMARHQQTLKDTIAWSYRLLTPDEQSLFRRLSVFRGGAAIESAVTVASDGAPRPRVLERLVSLVRKSLITQTLVQGEPRVRMLETIHDFAVQQLTGTSDRDRMHQRHAEHYLALAEATAPGLIGRNQRRCITALMEEEGNLRAALEWALQQADPGPMGRLLTALLWFWIPAGRFAEGSTWTGRALDRFQHLAPSRELGLILEAGGWIRALGGDYVAALPLFERAHAILHARPEAADRVRATITLAVTCLVLGDPRGHALSEKAVAGARALDDSHSAGLALLCAGIRHQMSGNARLAAASYEESLAAFTKSGDVFWSGQLLQNLALLRLGSGDWRRAATLGIQALEIGRTYNYPMIRNLSLAVMGAVAVARGLPVVAAQVFGAVHASLLELGVTFEPPEHAAMETHLEAARAALGAATFAAAFDEGRRWQERDLLTAVERIGGDAAA